jgi:exopolysaccharide transport family protein
MESGNLIATRQPVEMTLQTLPSQRLGGYPHPGGGPGLESSSLLHYWRVVLKRRWTVLATAVVILTLVVITTLRMTPVYDASSRVAINRESADNIGLKEQDSASSDDWDYTVALDTQVGIITSDALAMDVIKSQHLEKNPLIAGKSSSGSAPSGLNADTAAEAKLIANFHRNLKVSKIPHTRIVEITFSSPDPKLAAQLANALTDAYIEHNFRMRYEATMQASEWLTRQLADLQLRVETAQEQLVKYQRDNGILGIDEKQNIITEKLDQLNKDLTAAETERIQKEAYYRISQSGDPELVAKMDPQSLLGKLREQESDLKRQADKMSTTFGPSYPKLQEVNQQLAGVEQSIARETRRIGDRLKMDYSAALQREKMLRAVFEQQKTQANQLNERSIQYNVLKKDAETSRQLYENLQGKLKEAGVTAGLRSSNIRVVDSARVPVRPARPNVPGTITLGLLFSLMAGVILAFAVEGLDNTIRTGEEVELVSGLPSLGVIPLTNSSRNRKAIAGKTNSLAIEPGLRTARALDLWTLKAPMSEFAEAYRSLRTSILLSCVGGPPKVIVVTSALPQEGKTTTSINTAVTLAQRGSRVLLLDGDLRRPGIQKRFAIPSTTGLSELLSGTDVPQLLQPVPELPTLFVMTAGTPPPHPAELLSSTRMLELLRRWRGEFDHIVIDTPPVLSVTDSVVLSVLADSVLLVIRSGQTTKAALKRTTDVLAQVQAKILGVVLNAVNLNSPGHYYYYGYGSKYRSSYYRSDDASSNG